MTPDPKRPAREPIVYDPEYARLMGMSEKARLDFAAGNYYSLDEVVRMLEAEFGFGEDEALKPDAESPPEPFPSEERDVP